jgi:hypothetical protein
MCGSSISWPPGRSIQPQWAVLAAPVTGLVGLLVSASVTPAAADPLPYGPDTCINGYVWREARPGDTVCVTPGTRDQVAAENANAGANKDPSQAYGPESCSQGYVWRQAFDGDTKCVTPGVRTTTLADNAAAGSRKAANTPSNQTSKQGGTVTFKVTGSGHVYGIVTDPATAAVGDGATTPWERTIKDPGDSLYQVVVTTKDGAQGCRIELDGKVVAEQPIGNSPHCIYKP